MGLRDRLLHRIGVPTEPENVEKASRREKWKRQAWMIVSTLLTLWVALAVNVSLLMASGLDNSVTTLVTGITTLIIAFYVDAKYVFPWGVERFDLVLPWQFRDEEAKADG